MVAMKNRISSQIVDSEVVLLSQYSIDPIPRIYRYGPWFGLVCVIIGLIVENVWVDLFATILWNLPTIKAIVDTNRQVLTTAVCFTFELYYKVISMTIGMFSLQIINNWYRHDNYSNFDNKVVIFYRFDIVFSAIIVVTIISLCDGHAIPSKPKILFSTIAVGYFVYLLIETYFSHSTKVLAFTIANKRYTIHWKQIALSSLSSSIIFLIKQIVYMSLFPNKLATISFHEKIDKQTYFKQFFEKESNSNNNNTKEHNGKNIPLLAVNNFNINDSVSISSINNVDIFGSLKINNYNSDQNNDSSSNNNNSININIRNKIDDYDVSKSVSSTIDIHGTMINAKIIAYKDITLWLIIFDKFLLRNYSTKTKFDWSNRMSSKWTIFTCVFFICIYIIVTIIPITDNFLQTNDTAAIVARLFWLVIVIILAFNANFEIFLFEMTNNFSIYWRLLDLLIAYSAMLTIDSKYNEYGFDGSISIATLVFSQICKYLVLSIGIIGVSTAKSYITLNKATQCLITVIVTGFWLHSGIIYSLSYNDVEIVIFGQSLSMRDIIFVKIIDATVWFVAQFFDQLYYFDKLKINNVKTRWVYF